MPWFLAVNAYGKEVEVTERLEVPSVGDLHHDYMVKLEAYVALYCRPRPGWMPEALYRWLMSRVVLYETMPKVTNSLSEALKLRNPKSL